MENFFRWKKILCSECVILFILENESLIEIYIFEVLTTTLTNSRDLSRDYSDIAILENLNFQMFKVAMAHHLTINCSTFLI